MAESMVASRSQSLHTSPQHNPDNFYFEHERLDRAGEDCDETDWQDFLTYREEVRS
jgi:hypothetical protein